MNPWRALFIVCGVTVALALVTWGALHEPDNDRKATVATTYSSGESGAKALYRLLQESEVAVQRLRHLAYDDGSLVLWILAPDALPAGDADRLVPFMTSGGIVVAPPGLAADLLSRAGVSGAMVEKSNCVTSPCVLENQWGLRLTGDAAALQRLSSAEPDEVYATVADEPIVARYGVGAGGVVSIGAFDLLRNRAIGSGDSGPFWVHLAAELGEQHGFDEVHTGYGDLNVLTLLWRAPYRWAVVELGFVLLLAAWALGGRSLRAEADEDHRRRETKDHVQAVADWWGRSGDLGLPLGALLSSLEARASGRAHAPGGQSFVAWTSAVRPDLGARAADMWRQAQQLLTSKHSTAREVVTVAAALRAIEKEVFPC